MELILEEHVEEVVARSSKRPREYSDVEEGDGDTTEEVDVLGFRGSCKKLCIEEAAAALCSTTIIPSVMELEDLEELQEEQQQHPQQQGGGSMTTECCSNSSIISKEDAARVLRSLEEELGVSEEQSDDYASSSSSSVSSTPAAAASSSSAAQEALVDAAISSWSEEIIWNNSDHDGFVDTVEEDDEHDCVTAAAFSSGRSSLADEEEDRTAAQTGRSKGSDHHDLCTTPLVDIVFLKEASDDELGIPPSPNTERFLDDGLMGNTQQQLLHETSSMSVLSEAGALLEEAADGLPRATESSSHDHDHHLHDAVSWALQEMCSVEEDSDWLLMPVTGSLDFLLDFSTGGYVPVAT